VAGTADFYEQPQVANGGSQLLIDIFGQDIGAPARSAIGVFSLPGNIPVETEALFEVEE
jgi:enamine deaminase RidA (YjgF/YER057c/UK114 family)